MLMANMVTLTDEVEVDVIQYAAQCRRGLATILRSSTSNFYSEATQRPLVLFVAANSGRVKGGIPSIMGVFVVACWKTALESLLLGREAPGHFGLGPHYHCYWAMLPFA